MIRMDGEDELATLIGRNIRHMRNQENVSVSKLAKYLSISDKMLIEIESGKRGISIARMEKLANYFDKHADCLVCYKYRTGLVCGYDPE